VRALIISSMHACCLGHLILLPLIALATFGEKCNLWSFPLCNFRHLSRTSSLFSELSSQIPSIFDVSPWGWQSFTLI
jgi:hypothetical protein